MIPLFTCNALGPEIRSLDDPAVDTDLGAAGMFQLYYDVVGSITSVAVTPQPSEGESKLRRLVQNVAIGTSATVTLTPIVDGNESAADTQTFALTSVANGAMPTIEAHTANPGSRFQVRTEVTAHVGAVELGEGEQWTVPKLSSRTASS